MKKRHKKPLVINETPYAFVNVENNFCIAYLYIKKMHLSFKTTEFVVIKNHLE